MTLSFSEAYDRLRAEGVNEPSANGARRYAISAYGTDKPHVSIIRGIKLRRADDSPERFIILEGGRT
jgi:hypothetical protein